MISKEFTYRVIGDKRDVEKFTTCILGCALVFNLSGCGNTSDKTSSESKETNSKQEEKKKTTDEAKRKSIQSRKIQSKQKRNQK